MLEDLFEVPQSYHENVLILRSVNFKVSSFLLSLKVHQFIANFQQFQWKFTPNFMQEFLAKISNKTSVWRKKFSKQKTSRNFHRFSRFQISKNTFPANFSIQTVLLLSRLTINFFNYSPPIITKSPRQSRFFFDSQKPLPEVVLISASSYNLTTAFSGRHWATQFSIMFTSLSRVSCLTEKHRKYFIFIESQEERKKKRKLSLMH